MKEKYTAIIVDDESRAVELLQESLAIVNKKIEVISTFTTWTGALEALQTQKSDLLFLDISVNGRNSMDLLKCLPALESEIIFITAYADYTIEAFDYPVSGYILKPFDEVELARAVERAISRISRKPQEPLPATRKIGIPDNKSIHYVNIHDIVNLEAFNTYTKVFTTGGDEIVASYNIGKFRDLLPHNTFFTVHRSYIINLDHIQKYELAGTITMDNGQQIPVAKKHRDELLQSFKRIKAGSSNK